MYDSMSFILKSRLAFLVEGVEVRSGGAVTTREGSEEDSSRARTKPNDRTHKRIQVRSSGLNCNGFSQS